MRLRAEIDGIKALRRRLAAIDEPRDLLRTIALQGVREAKVLSPVATGNLRRTIRVGTVTARSAQVIAGGTTKVGYARYVEVGTGIYGPRRRRIVPRQAKMLSWVAGGSRATGKGKGSGRIFARSVRGRPATPYLVPGILRAIRKAGIRDAVVNAWNDAA
jgi:hypothetical protein